jgi:hypothetical protein
VNARSCDRPTIEDLCWTQPLLHKWVSIAWFSWKAGFTCQKNNTCSQILPSFLQEEKQEETQQNYGHWCCARAQTPVSVAVKLEKIGFVPGEAIRIHAHVTSSSMRVKSTEAQLLQVRLFWFPKLSLLAESFRIAAILRVVFITGSFTTWDATTWESSLYWRHSRCRASTPSESLENQNAAEGEVMPLHLLS